MSDPCEYVFSHEAAMRRLLSLLRDSQGYCTDSECLREGPGVDGNGLLQGNNLMLIVLIWGVLAVALYYLRPNSLRRKQPEHLEKPGPSSDQNGGNPPAPEIH